MEDGEKKPIYKPTGRSILISLTLFRDIPNMY